MTARMQQRRDTAANWTANNPTLASGELGLETDTGKLKIGNGSTAWTSLSYAATGTVTSVVAGTGLSGGTITSSGTIAIDSTVATLTDTQTLTNKTLTSPTLTTPSISNINAAGDLIVGTADNTIGIVSIGTTGQVLTVAGGTASWSTPAAGTTANDQAFAFAVQVFA